MAKEFVVTSENNPDIFRDLDFKGGAKTYSLDFSQWAQENNTVTSATWTTESGQAAISGQALSNNVATALVTFSESGGSLIKIIADSGTEKFVTFIDVVSKDPNRIVEDYGLCQC